MKNRLWTVAVLAVSLLLSAGCGSKDKVAESAPADNPPSTAVPATEKQAGQGIKQATQTRGEAEAARAAAFEAARKKAEGK